MGGPPSCWLSRGQDARGGGGWKRGWGGGDGGGGVGGPGGAGRGKSGWVARARAGGARSPTCPPVGPLAGTLPPASWRRSATPATPAGLLSAPQIPRDTV